MGHLLLAGLAWKFYALGPIFLLAGLSALFMFLYCRLARLGANARQLGLFKDRCIQLSMWVVYILYPAIKRSCFQMINCREFDPGARFVVCVYVCMCVGVCCSLTATYDVRL